MDISEHVQSAYEELHQELRLNCCEVVLKKRNALLILEILQRTEELVTLIEGNAVGSVLAKSEELRELLERMISWDTSST